MEEQEEKLREQLSRLSPVRSEAALALTAADALRGASPAEENRLWKLLVSEILYRREPGGFTLEVRLRVLPDL